MQRLLLALLLALPLVAQATPFYVDGTAGNNANNGLSRATAWRGWQRMLAAFQAGTVHQNDTVFVRPGRYIALDDTKVTLTAGGGLAGQPATVSVDTFYPGDVEVLGAITGSPWHQAYICDGSGSQDGVPCDDAAGVPIPSRCSGSCERTQDTAQYTGQAIYWSSRGDPGGRYMQGMVFRPTITPGGAVCTATSQCAADGGSFCDLGNLTTNGEPIHPPLVPVHRCQPKFAEILYSPEQTPVRMPLFIPGRFQTWTYKEVPLVCTPTCHNICSAAGVPWACCTGPGIGPGCLQQARIYAQMADGSNPTAANPPVLIPYQQIIETGGPGGSTTGPQYINFTNNNNGRTWHFNFAENYNLYLNLSKAVNFQDFRLGYASASTILEPGPSPWVMSGSAQGRNNGGSMYPIAGTWATESVFRRGIVHHGAGDETWHYFPNLSVDPAKIGMLAEDMEVYEQPWMVANGASNAAALGALHNSVDVYGYKVAWPPPGYAGAGTNGDPCTTPTADWCKVYPYFMSPLGGGGQSPGIIVGSNNTFRRLTYHHAFTFQIEGESTGCLIEDSSLNFGYVKYGGTGNSTNSPTTPVTSCGSGPNGACNGFSDNRSFSLSPRSAYANQPGTIIRNTLFSNCYLDCLQFAIDPPTGFPSLAPQVINCSFDIKTGALYNVPSFGSQLVLGAGFGTAGAKGIFSNNIITRDNPTGTLFSIAGANASTLTMNNNVWGQFIRWDWAGTPTNNFSSGVNNWKGLVLTGGCTGCETNSTQVADVGFVSSTDLHLAPTSPAIDTCPCLLPTDVDGQVRPMGAGGLCDCGGDEFNAGAPVTTTTSTSLTSTTSRTTTSVTSTTSTTLFGATTSSSTSSTSSSTSTSFTTSSTNTTQTTIPISETGLITQGVEERGTLHGGP